MIRSFNIKDPTKTHIPWMGKVLKEPRNFEFQPGLNILWGPNGSGKSTILTALARLFHCEQSGQPVITGHSIREVFPYNKPAKEVFDSFEVDHDGQGVRNFDPGHAAGLVHGHFDDDFFEMGLKNTLFKGSAGQTTMQRFNVIVRQVLEGEVPTLDQKKGYISEKDKPLLQEFLKGSGKKGPPTILLDEPERSLDLPMQIVIWRFLRTIAPTVQVIVASHSFFGLDIPGANVIEMNPGYLEKSKKCLGILKDWANDPTIPLPPHPTGEKPKGKKKT